MDEHFLVTLVHLMSDEATAADWITAINTAAVNSAAWHEGFIEHIFINAQHLVFHKSELLQLRHESLVALVKSPLNVPRPDIDGEIARQASKQHLTYLIHGLNINYDA